MATCAEIEAQIDLQAALVERFRNEQQTASGQINSLQTSQAALALEKKLKEIGDAVFRIKDKLVDLKYKAVETGCVSTANKADSLASQAGNIGFYAFDDARNLINNQYFELKKKEEETAKATTTQNNAGTGTPGTSPAANAAANTTTTGTTTATAPGTASPAPVAPGTDPNVAKTKATETAQTGTGQKPATGNAAPYATGTNRGVSGGTDNAQQQASRQDAANYALLGDWRVRLALAPGAKYLYDLPDDQSAGILAPLRATDGVIFPYTPTINVTYAANYEPTEVTHSNYKIFQYRSSSVDNITITCDFTAQDTHEANYLLAAIHFFRTVTKMFYGKDQDPKAGTPPPLCYLYGLGQFQFNAHPLLITNFTYVLPPDVDYIRATTNTTTVPGVNKSAGNTPNDTNNVSNQRLSQSPSGVAAGGVPNKPTYTTTSSGTVEPTYVPTKITITLQAVPVVARNDVSQAFSLKEYATGKLLQGSKRPGRGGVW